MQMESNCTSWANIIMTLFSMLEEMFKDDLETAAGDANIFVVIAVLLVSGTNLIQCTSEGSAAQVLWG